jgi:hypothetical protein
MKKYAFIIMVMLFALIVFMQSCEYENFEIIEFNEGDTVSFSETVLPVLIGNCLGSGCHESSGGVPPDLSEEFAYISLIGGEYLDLENPEESKLYKRLISASKSMPPAGKMGETKTKTILQWIKQGALDN